MCIRDLFINTNFSESPLGPEFWSIVRVIMAILYPRNRNKEANTYFYCYNVTSIQIM